MFLYKQSQQKVEKPVQKNYSFSDYIDLSSLVKKIFDRKLSIKEARKQQDAIEKKIKELHDRLNPSGPGKRTNLSTEKH